MSHALRSDWRYRAVIASVVLSALAYLAFSLWGGWREVLGAVARVGAGGIALALLMSLVNYGLRFLRWQYYLRALGHHVPTGQSLRIYLAGFALTTTPGKAGEMLRAVLLRAHAVPYRHGFAAFFSERLSDLLAIVVLALFGLAIYPAATPLTVFGLLAVLVALACIGQRRAVVVALRRLPAQGGRLLRGARHVLRLLLDAQRCHRPALLALASVLSLVAWSAEALAFWWLLGWLDIDAGFEFAAFVYAIAMLSGALSFLPGGLGGAEAVMIGLLVWHGAPTPDAVAATVLIRLATLWFAVAIGAAMLPLTGREAGAVTR
ncbi:lysylphosphatidylglycerol synthase transmembrane domain-containing protein [Pseudazoarcus pumilus]|uniref:TIGR00374 family protein n=1 Tax=Pseudazoarcus pumilus TaxID=2067960 RepID=A0A2I6S522_9RHOO|nr:lysylphosphatidylglycerol synthase transmembrane domain-containing protein [Pseudazoarcus pumilus]AUN94347.1 TIGR00374 family protein [Pseudazoarcus pumilus]